MGFSAVRERGSQRGRSCTCDHPVPSRACCCYTTRWNIRRAAAVRDSARRTGAFCFALCCMWMRAPDSLGTGPAVGMVWGNQKARDPKITGPKLVETMGNAPTWSCLQSKCITCLPRPQLGCHRLAAGGGAESGRRRAVRQRDRTVEFRRDWHAAVVLPHAGRVLETWPCGWHAACPENERGREPVGSRPRMEKERTSTVAGRYRCGHRRFAVDVSVFGAHLLRSPSSR